MMTQAVKPLPAETKAQLVDAFSGLQSFQLIFLLAFFGVYFLAARYTSWSAGWLFWGYMIGLAIFMIAYSVYAWERLKTVAVGQAYRRQYLIARMVSLGGLGLLLFVLADTF